MKKLLLLLSVILCCSSVFADNAYAAKKKQSVSQTYKVKKQDYFIGGIPATLRTFVKNGVTMVSARDLVEPCQAMLRVAPSERNPSRRYVGFVGNNGLIVYVLNEKTYVVATNFEKFSEEITKDVLSGIDSSDDSNKVDGAAKHLQIGEFTVSTFIYKGTLYVPLRKTVESLGLTLSVDDGNMVLDYMKQTGTEKKEEIPLSPAQEKSKEVVVTRASLNGLSQEVKIIKENDTVLMRAGDFGKFGMSQNTANLNGETYIVFSNQKTNKSIGFTENGTNAVSFDSYSISDISKKELKTVETTSAIVRAGEELYFPAEVIVKTLGVDLKVYS